jgi:hypothetical protein
VADSGSIEAGKAFVRIFTKDADARKGLQKFQATFRAWGAGLRSIGTKVFAAGQGLAAPLTAAAGVFAVMGDELAKASTRTGIAVEELSRLKYAADQSGTSLEGLEKGLKKMSQNLVAAATGGKEMSDTFKELGLNAEEMTKLKPDEQFVTIAEAISKVQNPTQRAAMAMKVFGKAGMELLPLMNDGAGGINELIKKCDELGLTMSTEDARAAEEFGDRLSDMWAVAKRIAFTLGGAVAPVLRSVALQLAHAGKFAKDFIEAHKGIVIAVGAVGAIITTVGAVIYGLGAAFSFVAGAVGIVLTAMSAVGSVIAAVGAAIASPLGLIVAGAAAATYAILKFTDVSSAVADFMSATFGDMKDDALTAFGGIRDALKAGDWALAAQIAGDLIHIAWVKAVGALKSLWNSVKFYANDIWLSIGDALLKATWTATEGFLKIWATTMHAWRSLVNTTADVIQDTFLATAKSESAGNMKRIDDAEKSGGITHEQAETQRSNERKFVSGYDDKIRQQRDQQNDSAFDKRMSDIKREYDEKRAMLDKLRQAEDQGAADGAQAEEAKLKAEVDALETKLKQQLAGHSWQAFGEAKAAAPELPKAPDFAAGLQNAGPKMQSSGTFSGAALFGLAGSGAAEETARNTKRIAELIAKNKGVVNDYHTTFA